MRKFLVLLGREVRSYFYSPIAYIVLVFFLLISGVDFYFQVSFMNQRQLQYTVQEAFFNSVFFWFAFVLIFPLITMRLFAEEFKLGTIEPLMTAPVRDWQVVLAKFGGALVFYIILWLPTLLYFLFFQKSHQPDRGRRSRRVLGLLSDAAVVRHVLPVGRVPGIGPDQKPDGRCGHFFLRDHSAVLPGIDSVRPARYDVGHPGVARLFLRDRAHGDVFARRHRYATDRSLSQHDRR